jgi:hypothetical protein
MKESVSSISRQIQVSCELVFALLYECARLLIVKHSLLQQGGMMVNPMMNGHLQGPMPVSGQVAAPVMLASAQQQVCWLDMSFGCSFEDSIIKFLKCIWL